MARLILLLPCALGERDRHATTFWPACLHGPQRQIDLEAVPSSPRAVQPEIGQCRGPAAAGGVMH
jgi:hypothetical protein